MYVKNRTNKCNLFKKAEHKHIKRPWYQKTQMTEISPNVCEKVNQPINKKPSGEKSI